MANIGVKSSGPIQMIEAKIHLFEDNISQKRYKMSVPLVNDEYEIIKMIIPANQIIKEKWGYKLIDGNTEKRVTITKRSKAVKARGFSIGLTCRHYRIDVTSARISKSKNNSLVKSEESDEVILSVDGRNINADKLILANASPVFKAMMLTESPSNKVKINDISYDTTRDLLDFISTGKLPDVHAKDSFLKYSNLLKAVDNHCIEDLKTKCKKEISQVLSSRNIIDWLKMADTCNSSNLRRIVIEFIVDNEDKIINLPSYQTYMYEHPEISAEIVRVLFAKHRCAT